jgi:hypothetical protein
MGEPTFGESLTMEEIEATLAEGEKPEGEGDDVPEAYRGKSLKEIIAIAETTRSSMNERLDVVKIASEAAARAAGSMSPRNPEPPPPEAPKELTRDELKALYEEDPLRAIEVIEQQAAARTEAHLNARMAPLTDGILTQAENWARQEFATEFELFGDDIKKVVEKVGNKSVFTQKQAWEDAVAYVRGKAGNFEKLIEHQQKKAGETAAASAREAEARRGGYTGSNRGTTSTPPARSMDNAAIMAGMSDEERTIAQRFIDDGVFKDMKEYQLWNRREGA